MITAILTFLATLAFAVGPFFAPDFRGFAPDLFPIPQTDPLIQPAGYAFSIWAPLFLWLTLSAIFGIWMRRDEEDWVRMRPALILSVSFGATWLQIAQQDPILATAMLWLMWLMAVVAMFRTPGFDLSMAAWPIGLYAGWLTLAACLATALCLVGFGLMQERIATQSLLAAGLVLAALMQWKLARTPTFGLAVIWGLVAVYVANVDRAPQIALQAAISAGIIVIPTLRAAFRDLRPRRA